MKTITMTEAEKNIIAVGTEVVVTRKRNGFLEGDVLIITEQNYDYIPWAKQKYGSHEEYISVGYFAVLDTSTTAPTTTAVKLLPGERPKYGVVYTVTNNSWTSAMGWEVVLETDDGTSNPWFVRTNGLSMEGFTRISVTLDRLTYESKQTATPVPTQSDEQLKRSLPVGTRVRLTADLYPTHHAEGAEGVISMQDGSDMPFIEFDGSVYDLYVETKDFEAIPDEQPVEVTQDNLAFGQVYKLLGWGHSATEGDLVVLKANDGSENPWFIRLSDGEDVVAWLNQIVAVNVVESKQSKELET